MPGPYSGLPLEWLWLGIALKEGDRRNGMCFQTSSSSIFPVISWFFFLCFFSLLLEPTWCGGLCGYALCRGVDSGSFEAWLVIIAKADRHVRALCRPESELGGLASPADSRGRIRVSKGCLNCRADVSYFAISIYSKNPSITISSPCTQRRAGSATPSARPTPATLLNTTGPEIVATYSRSVAASPIAGCDPLQGRVLRKGPRPGCK